MRKITVVQLCLSVLSLTGFAIIPSKSAVAHEEHKMECNESSMNAMHADAQAMSDGEAKTTAIKEMEMAKGMMAKDDMEGCMEHMHRAMEAME